MPEVQWIPSPNYSGNMGPKREVVLHWWGDPAQRPSFTGTVNWLRNPDSQVSAHYVVSGQQIAQLVDERNVAWHARDANAFSIGIEVDPNTPGATYDTVIWLVRDITRRHGMNLPGCIKRHRDYVNTQCPGTLDIERIKRGATTGGTNEVTPEQDFGNCWITQAQEWPTPAQVEDWKRSGLPPYEYVQRHARNVARDIERINAFKACFITLSTRWPSDAEIDAWMKSGISAYEWCQRHAPNVVRDQKEEEIRNLHIALEKCEQSGNNTLGTELLAWLSSKGVK